jgi:hypothetical protein
MTQGDRSVLCTIILLMLLSLIPAARGQHAVSTGTGIVCDTAD